MIQNVLCKNPWLDYNLEVDLLRKSWKTTLKIRSVKKRDSRMKTVPQLMLSHEIEFKLMEKASFKFQSPFKLQ